MYDIYVMQTIVQIIGYTFVISFLLAYLIAICYAIITIVDEFSKNKNLLEKIDRVEDYLLIALITDIGIILINIVISLLICCVN